MEQHLIVEMWYQLLPQALPILLIQVQSVKFPKNQENNSKKGLTNSSSFAIMRVQNSNEM
jgi:hypothetical protein